jgi:hypothetical protein
MRGVGHFQKSVLTTLNEHLEIGIPDVLEYVIRGNEV